MANAEKDRYGDTLRKKEKGQEEEYFARRERELIERLRGRQQPAEEPSAPGSPSRSQGRPFAPASAGEAGSDSQSAVDSPPRGGAMGEPARRGLKGWLDRLLGGSGSD